MAEYSCCEFMADWAPGRTLEPTRRRRRTRASLRFALAPRVRWRDPRGRGLEAAAPPRRQADRRYSLAS